MNNEYEIFNPFPHLPMASVSGKKYDYRDLYDLVGKFQSQSTYDLKPNSPSYQLYGESVTGTIFYSKKEWDFLAAGKADRINTDKIKVDTALIEDGTLTEKLKYEGINIADIENLSYTTFIWSDAVHDTGEKIMPNVIEIPFKDDGKTDLHDLMLSYLRMKLNSGTDLIRFEKEKFVGLMLGIRQGVIDSRWLDRLGLTLEEAKSSLIVKYWRYTVREARGTITEKEKEDFPWVKLPLFNEKASKFVSEMEKAGIGKSDMAAIGYPYEELFRSLIEFEPSIVLHGIKQVYWNVDSYIHIVLRHVKEFQPGRYQTTKTPFPYKFKDLEMLMYKVLGSIQNEIERHFREHPGKKFFRMGARAARFNGDYYGLNIDEDGRLASFWCYGDS